MVTSYAGVDGADHYIARTAAALSRSSEFNFCCLEPVVVEINDENPTEEALITLLPSTRSYKIFYFSGKFFFDLSGLLI
jgi:hypothetical protein